MQVDDVVNLLKGNGVYIYVVNSTVKSLNIRQDNSWFIGQYLRLRIIIVTTLEENKRYIDWRWNIRHSFLCNWFSSGRFGFLLVDYDRSTRSNSYQVPVPELVPGLLFFSTRAVNILRYLQVKPKNICGQHSYRCNYSHINSWIKIHRTPL